MGLRQGLYKLSAALQRRIVPGLRYSQETYEARLNQSVPTGGAWLDIGCGHALLPDWRAENEPALMRRCRVAVGADVDIESLRRNRSFPTLCGGDVSSLPFRDGVFDLVTANMVVEHLREPRLQFMEIDRVLRAGGLFMFHTPNAGNYLAPLSRLIPDSTRPLLARVLDGRKEEDVYPTYYRANTAELIEAACRGTRLVVEALEYVNSTPVTSMIPPLVVPELLLLRQLQRPELQKYRATIICRLRKMDR